MRAVRFDRFGGPEVLNLEDVDTPEPSSGEVRIRVSAAALNPKDIWIRTGRYRWLSGTRFPMGTGFDVAGIVDVVGQRVTALEPGDAVFGFLNGFRGRTCAEHVVLPAEQCARAPQNLSMEEAAALPLAASTALQALRDCCRLEPGSRVLLHGASGGVGVHAIQIANAMGAKVTTTSGPHNLSRCLTLGSHEALTYEDPDAPFQQDTLYDAVFDIYGNRNFKWARRGLKPSGTYVTTVPSHWILGGMIRSLFVPQRAQLVRVQARRSDLEALTAFVQAGTLKAVVDRILPLEDVAEGHAHIQRRHARGKVVIKV